jgi:hypothetical protein
MSASDYMRSMLEDLMGADALGDGKLLAFCLKHTLTYRIL